MRCPRCGKQVVMWHSYAGTFWWYWCPDHQELRRGARYRWLALLRWWVVSEPWKRFRLRVGRVSVRPWEFYFEPGTGTFYLGPLWVWWVARRKP